MPLAVPPPRRLVPLKTLWLPDFDVPPPGPDPEWPGSADVL